MLYTKKFCVDFIFSLTFFFIQPTYYKMNFKEPKKKCLFYQCFVSSNFVLRAYTNKILKWDLRETINQHTTNWYFVFVFSNTYVIKYTNN